MSIIKGLKEPFPYYGSPGNHLRVASFFGVFIFLFLFIFKPFDLGKYENDKILFVSLGYALVSFGVIFTINVLLPKFFPAYYNERSWTTGRQIMLMLMVIFLVGLGNYFASPLLVDSKLNLYYFFWFQGITLAVALLPVSIYFLIRQNILLQKFSREARHIEEKLLEKIKSREEIPETITTSFNRLQLTGENQNERIEVFPDDLYLVSSASNYVKVFHLKKDKLVFSILRSTLKRTEEVVLTHPNFFKCHRAFIINLDKVIHVEGNAQGYKVRLENYEELIPVSRNLNNEFSDKLLAFRNISAVS